MKAVKICNKQMMYWHTQDRVVSLRDELRKLITKYKSISTPICSKINMKRSKFKKEMNDLEGLIDVKKNSLQVNYEMHKMYANSINQGLLIKIDFDEFDYGVFKTYTVGAY